MKRTTVLRQRYRQIFVRWRYDHGGDQLNSLCKKRSNLLMENINKKLGFSLTSSVGVPYAMQH